MIIKLFLRIGNILKRAGFPFWKILLFALLLRLIWALTIPVIPISDSHAYDTFAVNIWQNSTFGWNEKQPQAYWPVGIPAIYASFYAIFGHVFWPIVAFNIAMGVGITASGMRICRYYFGENTGTLCGLILAIWPSQIMFVTVLASELPYTFLALAALDVWISSNRHFLLRSIVVGILLAGASYIRPLALLLPFVYALSLAIYTTEFQKHFGRAIISFCIILLLIAPWTYRNYKLYGAFVPISTNGPITLWMGNHPNTNGSYAKLPDDVKSLNDFEKSQILGMRAKKYILDHPGEFLYRSMWKLVKLHAYETINVSWNILGIKQVLGSWIIMPLKVLSQGYWFLVLFGAIIGLVVLFRREKWFLGPFHPVVLPWAYYSVVHAIILVQDRYHFPAIPFIAALAAVAIITALGMCEEDRV